MEETFRYVSGPVPAETIEGTLVRINPSFYRPAEVDFLCGDSTQIRTQLGWAATVSFKQLVSKMVQHDFQISENSFGCEV